MHCDDGNACTGDVCEDEACSNDVLLHSPCADGGFCGLAGTCAECTLPQHCGDARQCTADSCVDGTCVNEAQAEGTGCDGGLCTAAGDCAECVDNVPCDDSNACTANSCVEGRCETANVGRGTQVAGCSGAQKCDGTGQCVTCLSDAACGTCRRCNAQGACVIDNGASCDAGFNCSDYVAGAYVAGTCHAYASNAIAGTCNTYGACVPPASVACIGTGYGTRVINCDSACAKPAGSGCIAGARVDNLDIAAICYVDQQTEGCKGSFCHDPSASNSYVRQYKCISSGACRDVPYLNCGNYKCQSETNSAACSTGCTPSNEDQMCVALGYCESGQCCQQYDNPECSPPP